jgi:hypothetical protein
MELSTKMFQLFDDDDVNYAKLLEKKHLMELVTMFQSSHGDGHN